MRLQDTGDLIWHRRQCYSGNSSKGDTAGVPARVRLTLVTEIGAPSDSKSNSYFLSSFAALHLMLETCCVLKFPTCLQIPADDSTDGDGSPSTFGLSLDFSSIRSIGSSNRLSVGLRPFYPEKVMMC